MKSSIHLVIADSSEVFIEGIKSWSKGFVNIVLVGICRDWNELNDFSNITKEQIVVITQCKWLQHTSKTEIEEFLTYHQNIRIAAFCSNKKRKQILTLMDAGVCGFFNPGTGQEEFIYGLMDVAHDQNFISEGLKGIIQSAPSSFNKNLRKTATNNLYFSGN